MQSSLQSYLKWDEHKELNLVLLPGAYLVGDMRKVRSLVPASLHYLYLERDCMTPNTVSLLLENRPTTPGV